MPYQQVAAAGVRILICEDELLFAEDIAITLGELGYEIAGIVVTGEEAIRIAEEVRPDLILMDINLPGEIDGIEAAQQIRTQSDIPIVYLTAYAETDVFERAKHTEPYGYVSKPVRFLELTNTIRTALYKHEADRKVKESEALRAKAEELAGLHSWEWNIRTGCLVWSAEAYRTFGFRPGETELIFDTFISSVHADDRDAVRSAVQDAVDGKRPYDFEFRIVQTDGQERVLHSRGEIQRDAKGQAIRMQGMSLDITDRKRTEEALQQSEEKFRLFMDNSPTIAWMKDDRGRHVYHSQTYEKRFGVRLDDWRGKNDYELWPREVADSFRKNDQAVLASGYPMEVTEETIDSEGQRCSWLTFKFPFRDASGNRYVGGIGIDITDRKKAEEALRESEERYRVLFEGAAEGILVADIETKKLCFANPAICKMFGYT